MTFKMKPDPKGFLGKCETIDFDAESIVHLAANLRHDIVLLTAKNCFEWVRDHIKHSSDLKLNPVTCVASDVLAHGTGFCYAKSHLLCALLRANQIPAGLCYQRLSINGLGAPFCLHGLNAIYLHYVGWYRVDPRGNRDEINAQFTPPIERLAFATTVRGECDLPHIYPSPLSVVVDALRTHDTWDKLCRNLPDVSSPVDE